MKICVFSDIHGNIEQLEKLTKTKDFLDADLRICLGDIVGLGPYQKECMDLLYKFQHIIILGNHEARIIKLIDDIDPDIDYEFYRQFEVYREQLKDYIDYFKDLKREYILNIANKKLFFTHYGWHNNNMANKEIILRNKPLLEQFYLKKNEYDYVIYGHIHTPSESVEEGTKFINVGSLGLKSPSNYMMIEEINGELKFDRKFLEFDKNKFLEKCEKLNFPKWEQLKNYSFDNSLEKNSGTVLVTGGAGYIGTNVTLKLIENGYKVAVIDNFSNSYTTSISKIKSKYPKNINIYNFDILDTEKLEEVIKKESIYSVIHLAGKKYVPESFENEDEYLKNNVTLTKNLLNILEKNKIKNLVFSSSITVYGKPNCPIVDENEKCEPLSPYANQKLECEKLIKKWQQKTKSSAVVLRLSNPIGANTSLHLGDNPKTKKYKGILPYILEKSKQNEKLTFNGGDHPTKDGTTIRDYIHVEDVATAFINAMKCDNGKFEIYNVGSSTPGYSVLDILHETEKCLNKKLNYDFGPKREGDVSVFISNNEKVKNKLNLKITKTLYDMIESQVDFEKSTLE